MNPVPLPPGRGGLYSPLCVELLKLAVRQAQSRLPPPGEVPPQAGIGVHFLALQARLYGFHCRMPIITYDAER